MSGETIVNNNMVTTIVRNVVYKKINAMKRDIKELIEVDNNLLESIDINMKNAINKILHDYKLQQ